MKIDIQEEKNNPLLNRRELKVNIIHDGPTPTRADVISKLKAVTKAKKDTVIVKSFHSKFGARESSGIVRIYDSKERAMEIEPKFMLEKNLIGKEIEKKEEKPTDEKKPAKEHPKETAKPEKKEEKPADEKKPAKEHPKETAKPEKKEEKPADEKKPAKEHPKETTKPEKKEEKPKGGEVKEKKKVEKKQEKAVEKEKKVVEEN